MTTPFIDDDIAVETTDPEPPGQSDRVLLGVAGLIADALGVDALWVRIGFVLLGLAGGVGVVLYLGVWLALIGPRTTDAMWVRYLGGVIVVAGVPLMIATVDVNITTGPLVVLVLLIALAVALWQPRVERPGLRRASRLPLPPPVGAEAPSTEPATDDDLVPGDLATLASDTDIADIAPTPDASATPGRRRPRLARRPRRLRRPRREPSVLGRWTLGLAMIVASTGALVDEFNGGRLHPEQWLGAAAVTCGLGLLVGAVRGRARWLIIPVLILGAAGFGAGVLARMGIGIDDAFGDRTIGIFDDTPGGVLSTRVAAGQVWIDVGATPEGPVTVDARIGFGNINIGVYADSDVAVEVRTEIDRGEAQLNGRTQDDDIMRLGPAREPDVIVLAHVGVGQVHLDSYPGTISLPQREMPLLGDGPFDPLVDAPGEWTQVTNGMTNTSIGG